MNTKQASIITLMTFAVFACSDPTTGKIEEYFQTRDQYIKQFENAPLDADEQPALKALENKLKSIVDIERFSHFDGETKINLETLFPELGFGQLDGLYKGNAHQGWVVTNRELLSRFIANKPEYPRQWEPLKRYPPLLGDAFYSNAFVTIYGEIGQLTPPKGMALNAYFGLAAQDTGNFKPAEIFIILDDGAQVAFGRISITTELPTIDICEETWQKKQADEKSINIESLASSADNEFVQCYGHNLVSMSAFRSIRELAQNFINKVR